MGRELLSSESVFRATLEQCETLLAPLASWSLMEELTADESESRLGETEIAQPAIFALQVALAALWRSWGVEPSAIVGHSLGEVAAAYVAGALSLEDAVRIVFHRGRLMQQGMGQGKMAAVPLPYSEAEVLLAAYAGRLSIAAINSPTSVVLSGSAAALEEVIQSLEERQIFCKFLPVNYAFHSPQMEPYQDEYMRSLQGINPQAASIPIISTITGKAQDGREFNSDYWRRSIREPVQFAAAIEQLAKTKHDLFIELSPHPVLAMNISQCLQASSRPGVVLPSLRRQEAEKFVMLRSLGSLYTLGYPIKWNKFYHKGGRCVSLPSYPWQRERYWVGKENVSVSVSSSPAVSSLNVAELKLEFSITKAQFLAELPQERQQLLESYLRALLAKVMGLSAAKVDLDVPLYSLGLDSLMAIELKKRIEKDLEVFIALEYFVGLNVAQFVQQLILLIEGKVLSEPEEEVSQPNLWFGRKQPNPGVRLRLFCFSYAGGGASIFSSWSKELPPEIEVCPIQLPGREERLGESPFTRLTPLIQTLVPLITPYLDIPFAFFGHSLGALISFELARELRRQNLPSPIHLFVSASRAPHILDLDLPIHRLPDSKFLESLRRLNGTPEEVLQNPELMQLFLPALRADFAILETYFYATEERLHCPISAFGGVKDNIVSQTELAAWCDQTDGDFRMLMFPGDHFFLHPNRQQLLQAIAQEIQKPVLK
jgi:surfactin synthase thioesterase subunit/malonyl CoA-acyl carrier protein transacylase/acyl carrier protein